jgi:hypothetical protein
VGQSHKGTVPDIPDNEYGVFTMRNSMKEAKHPKDDFFIGPRITLLLRFAGKIYDHEGERP